MTLRLSILDQSIVRRNGTAREALEETIATAKLAERLGYTRFWVSEHHNSAMIAGSAPEVLMVRLASETLHIRIGSGGIMLPNHSALKVAENFRLLETLYPGRIDLGMGRAPGGDRITAALLNPSNNFAEEAYLQQLEHLQAFFTDKAATQYGPVLAVPQSETQPLQWILSSSGGSSAIAARFGTGLAVAKFINGAVGPDVVQAYRKQFEPSESFSNPAVLVAVQVICAESEEKAAELRKMSDFVLLQFEKGIFGPLPDPSDVAAHEFSEYELERIRFNSGRIISGTRAAVKKQMESLSREFDVQEIMASCMTAEPADRKRSFELLAEIFS